MVFVNDKKYACETCIKGHRSSTCNHRDRPLFEIKKKGRPITQCEHCRELRKTKQVHVKCLCEGRDDSDPVSHSIPAKKANRKGPAPAAAFPNGLPPMCDTEEFSSVSPKAQSPQRGDTAQPCSCKTGSQCNCATPRQSAPRRKRGGTPSKAKVGDLRATSSHPASEAGDLELKAESLPHELSHGHGHGMRSTHGASLYNPYGLAHDLYLRGHDASVQSRGYTYPVLPLAYDQQPQLQQQEEPSMAVDQRQLSTYGLQTEVSPTWGTADRYTDADNLLSALNAQEPESQSTSVFSSYGTVDVDAWLRQIMDCNQVVDGYSSDSSTSGSSFASQTLAVPSSLNLSGALSHDQELSSAAGQFGMYSDLSAPSADFDLNKPFFSGNTDGSDNGIEPPSALSSGTFDQGLLSLPAFRADAADKSNLIHAPTPFPAFPSLTLGYSDESLHRADAAKGEETGYVIDDNLLRLHERHGAMPPLSRSSSTGSHVSSRSHSSFGAAAHPHGFGHGQSDVWHNAYDHGYSSAETGLWPYPSFHHAQAAGIERGRAYTRGSVAQQQQPTVAVFSQSPPKDIAVGAGITGAAQFSVPYH